MLVLIVPYNMDKRAQLSIIDSIISCLGVNQQTLDNTNNEPPDLTSFPVEFDYLTRCLHAMGPDFFVFRLIDTNKASMESAIIYAITGRMMKKNITLTYEDILNECCLNALIVGPDKQRYTFIHHSEYNPNKLEPFVILYKSYDNLYYPLECLNKYHQTGTVALSEGYHQTGAVALSDDRGVNEKKANVKQSTTNCCVFYKDNIILQQYLSRT